MSTWPRSLWAAVTPPAPQYARLQDLETADVAIIGAGFTGLSTALHLVEAGVDVAVIEAVEPGWGASGRSNGQIIPALTRAEPDQIIARHGEAGERFVCLLRDSAAGLFDLVRRHGLAAEAEQTGWVQPVHSLGRMPIAERRVDQWSRLGAPVELLGRDAMRRLLGSEVWHGGWWNRSGGHINPLALVREMARAVTANGGRLYARSPVASFTRGRSKWIVDSTDGRVEAPALVLATNAYTSEFSTSLAPAVAREIVPVRSWQLATEPLSDALRRIIIPGRQAMSDTHGDLHFMRYDARQRLVTGGALVCGVNGDARLERRIGRRLQHAFPEIGTVRFDHVWNGFIGMTMDYMPRVHRLGPDAYAWAGCNGRAVGLALALGAEVAKAVRGVSAGDLALPFSEPRPVPLHGLVRRLAPLRLLELRYRDAREPA